MPSWKINCLKSEDGPHPSISTTDETNKVESTPLSTDPQCTGKFLFLFLCDKKSKIDYYLFNIIQDLLY
jgi:hypothetical protein